MPKTKSSDSTKIGFPRLRFTPSLFAVDEADYSGSFKTEPVKSLYELGFKTELKNADSVLLFLYKIADSFLQNLSKTYGLELSREKTLVELQDDAAESFLSNVPFAPGSEYVNLDWLKNLWNLLNKCFDEEISDFSGSVAIYLAEKDPNLKTAERIFFHLVENKNGGDFPFSFLATYSTKNSDGSIRHAPLKYALTEYKNDQDKILELLSCLNRAADVSPLVAGFIESGEMFHPLRLTSEEAYELLKAIPAIEKTGIVCRIPDWWKKKKAKVKVGAKLEKKESILGLKTILEMDGYLEVDGEKLSKAEVKKLLASSEGLSFIKGKWVEVDKERLKKLLCEMKKYSGEISMLDALRMGLNQDEYIEESDEKSENQDDLDADSIKNGEWISSLLKDLRSSSSKISGKAKLPETFRAKLRPYQKTGWEWLVKMMQFNFGACLADDMGLGKTVQVLALLETMHVANPDAKVLLVVPASLLANWQNECEKFAPDLTVGILHSSVSRRHPELDSGSTKEMLKHATLASVASLRRVQHDGTSQLFNHHKDTSFLSITTYSMVSRLTEIAENEWDLLILDEAQAIKNPSSKQTKMIKSLHAKNKIALTGTPVENDLTNLWSLYDFLDKGLLGSAAEFKKFAKSISKRPDGYAKLKAMITPFMLRRLKTDKNVISDLPEKLEMTDYVTLSKKQRALYKKFVDDLAEKLEELKKSDENPMARRGLVLSSLMKLKQICNHPDEFTGSGEFDAADSGKFEMLSEICQTIYEKRERVLVFTQFKEITKPLDNFLSQVFGTRGFVLHGGTTVKKRAEMVEKFQSDEYIPYMVISVKAGGTGLNLTNANHVVHFDRWWNPAVENQATDRAFRIGQTKNVMVHKFVARGTIEEKIDELIRKKTELAKNVISADSGESWITEMSDSELMNLFSLDNRQ